MSVLSVLKFGFARRGGRNRCIKDPAKVTLVSWPSSAVCTVIAGMRFLKDARNLLMLGVMNIH